MKNVTEDQVISLLVKMADSFDHDGDHSLASEVDNTIKSFSSRPKAPLKNLDDDVKKNLIIFIHDADQSNGKAIECLNELFRRLRYFDFADTAKDLGLEKVIKTLEGTRGGLGDAKKKFYEMVHGKRPSKTDLEELFSNIVKDKEEDKNEQNAIDFFNAHSEYGCEDEEQEEIEDISDDELEEFLQSIE